ncbi:hypothetical protein OHS18_05850 [Amycolatopsis sp. NBC_00355]|uniref:hypothetical protein n=1 Tax=Amycolatopsis sp. NBC_00355 TaxID=2975957 RepID=UPI002E26FAEF
MTTAEPDRTNPRDVLLYYLSEAVEKSAGDVVEFEEALTGFCANDTSELRDLAYAMLEAISASGWGMDALEGPDRQRDVVDEFLALRDTSPDGSDEDPGAAADAATNRIKNMIYLGDTPLQGAVALSFEQAVLDEFGLVITDDLLAEAYRKAEPYLTDGSLGDKNDGVLNNGVVLAADGSVSLGYAGLVDGGYTWTLTMMLETDALVTRNIAQLRADTVTAGGPCFYTQFRKSIVFSASPTDPVFAVARFACMREHGLSPTETVGSIIRTSSTSWVVNPLPGGDFGIVKEAIRATGSKKKILLGTELRADVELPDAFTQFWDSAAPFHKQRLYQLLAKLNQHYELAFLAGVEEYRRNVSAEWAVYTYRQYVEDTDLAIRRRYLDEVAKAVQAIAAGTATATAELFDKAYAYVATRRLQELYDTHRDALLKPA